VDWEKLGNPQPPEITAALYLLAVNNVPRVGKRIGKFISWLRSQNVVTFPKIHIVGHSLGAHVAGLSGLYLQNRFNGEKIARVTGTLKAFVIIFACKFISKLF
jgi:dienelactone hydrolase